jgi:hypothetical protein
MTPAEAERLRQVSYERQLARGFKRPGFAGVVAERFGDANNPYTPLNDKHHRESSVAEELHMLPKPAQPRDLDAAYDPYPEA